MESAPTPRSPSTNARPLGRPTSPSAPPEWPTAPPPGAGANLDKAIPADPFRDLLTAFRSDQKVTRYPSMADVLHYCKYSANPVGLLVLRLCGYSDAERVRLSDTTCTALQLANFWQDVTVDWKKDRVYIPLDILERHGYTVDDLFARRFTPAFREVMREIVAEDWPVGREPISPDT